MKMGGGKTANTKPRNDQRYNALNLLVPGIPVTTSPRLPPLHHQQHSLDVVIVNRFVVLTFLEARNKVVSLGGHNPVTSSSPLVQLP